MHLFGVKDSCHSFCVSPQDDMLIRVFNYNTLGKVHMFEAHHDYIRCIAVHPTQPYILTCSGREELHALYTHTQTMFLFKTLSSLNCKSLFLCVCVSRRHVDQAVGLGPKVVVHSSV